MSKFVYFMRPVGMEGPIKIGCADYPGQRLATYMAWSPFDLEMLVTTPGGYDVERNVHECFSEHHRRGEWFDPAPALLALIEKLKLGVPLAEAVDLSKRTGSIRKGKTKNIHPYVRERMSYLQSVNYWMRKHGKRGEYFLRFPADVSAILDRWQGRWQDPLGTMIRPTAEERVRLAEFKAGLPGTAVVHRYNMQAA